MNKFTIVFFSILIVLASCKKDSANSSRTLRYEASGNFTGMFIVSYTTASGGTTNEQVTLPWSKEIDYTANVTAAVIAITGNGGVEGQRATLIIKRDGRQSGEPIEATANSLGSFSKAAPVVVF